MKIFPLVIYSVKDAELPTEGVDVLLFHEGLVDRGARYGSVWRLGYNSEDQLFGVSHWAILPSVSGD